MVYLAKLEAFLSERNLVYQTFLKSYPPSLSAYTCLIIIGGDGTINHVLNHFRDIAIPIAFIPGGTGNDYASLHLRGLSLEQQFELAIGQYTCHVDAGTCNNKLFINGVGIGFDGWVVKRNLGKRFFDGFMAYYSTIVSLLLFYKESHIHIKTPEAEWDQPAFMLSIAKGKTYGGGFMVAPLASPVDGAFDFISIAKIGLLKRFNYLPVIEKGRHLNLPFVTFNKTTHIEIEAQHPLQAHLDGEWMESKNFTLQILPKKYLVKSAVY